MRRIKNQRFRKFIHPYSKMVIGMLGDDRGVGTTHTALLVANYFSNWVGLKTCYIEYGTQNQMIGMMSSDNITYPRENGIPIHPYNFIYEDIICYPSLQEQQLSFVLSEGYQCIIVDFGIKSKSYYHEILRCDKRYLITSLKPWRINSAIQNFLCGKWSRLRIEEVIAPFGNRKEISQMHHTIEDIQVYPIPYEPNPFVISERTLKVLNQIFQ